MRFFEFLKTRIGRRLLATFLALSLMPLLVMGRISRKAGESALRKQTRLALRAASNAAEGQLREFLSGLKQKVVTLASDAIVRDALNPAGPATRELAEVPLADDRLSHLLVSGLDEYSGTRAIFVINSDGIVVASSDRERLGQDVSATEYFTRGKLSFFPGDVSLRGKNGAIEWIMTAPVQKRDGSRLMGVVACDLDPNTLSELTTGRRILGEGADTHSFRTGDTGETYLVNRSGLMITESKFIPNSVLQVNVNSLPVKEASTGREIIADYIDYRGVEVSGASVIFPEMGWVMLTETDFSQAFTPIKILSQVRWFLTAGLALLLVMVCWYWTWVIIQPLETLRRSDLAMAVGNEADAIASESDLPANEIGKFVRTRNVRVKALFEKQRQLVLEQDRRTKASAELEEMSYSIVHDMRAPLRAIVAYSQIVNAASSLNEEQHEFLSRMSNAALRMDRLICDMLSYSRLVREQLPMKPVNLSRLLREILETYPAFHALHTRIHVAADLPEVQGNDAALTQCFTSLLDNAIKFVKPGEVPEIHIVAERIDGWIRIWVEDNGIGIPRDSHQRIFGIYQQMRNSQESTGIGLAIVRKATERMGGRVGLVSEVGHGSRFWIELQPATPP